MQNVSSGPISDPHFTQEGKLVSFFFLGFLVFPAFLVVFFAAFLVFFAAFLGLEGFFFAISPTSPSSVMVKPSAPSFIPDLFRYRLSYSSSSCWRDFLPVPACTCLGLGAADGSGSDADPACVFHILPVPLMTQVSDVVVLGSNPYPDRSWLDFLQIPGRRCTTSCKSLACV